MAAERSSLKRKPLSDCTNTIAARSDTVRRKSSLRSALTQPPRSSSEKNNEAPAGSLKSNTSTGSNNPPISTSARSTLWTASRGSEHGGSEHQETKKKKGKGKAVEDFTVIQPHRPSPVTMKLSSASASGGSEHGGSEHSGSEHQETKRKKGKGKAVVEDFTVIQPHPPSPVTMKLSSATVSGTDYPDLSKCRTVYTRKRVPEGRNLRSLKITEPISCPPLKRLKDKGKKVDDGGGYGKYGTQRDSFPVRKKQYRGKSKHEVAVDAMPKEEVEKLRAYYADIDAFDLPVEEAKPNDSD